jgi:hypothetical protein
MPPIWPPGIRVDAARARNGRASSAELRRPHDLLRTFRAADPTYDRA